LIFGPIASGPILVAATAFAKWLRERNRSYLAVEMEAAGLLAACSERVGPTRSLVLRGISDYADHRKAELDKIQGGALRRYAMQNVISLLWALMQTDSLPR
jgi:nucleoside phosphorylase